MKSLLCQYLGVFHRNHCRPRSDFLLLGAEIDTTECCLQCTEQKKSKKNEQVSTAEFFPIHTVVKILMTVKNTTAPFIYGTVKALNIVCGKIARSTLADSPSNESALIEALLLQIACGRDP